MTSGLKNSSRYYLELMPVFPPRPITNELEYEATQTQLNKILDKGVPKNKIVISQTGL
jgi:HTH-type transcriptional regulator / antitoxin HigA